jgi:hypothetical protein
MSVDWTSLYRAPAASSTGFDSTGGTLDLEDADLRPTLDWRMDDMPDPVVFDPEELAGEGPLVWFRRLAADPTGREGLGAAPQGQTLMGMLALEIEAEERGAETTGFLVTVEEDDG